MYFEQQIPILLELGFPKARLEALKSFIDFLWATNEELNLISRKMSYEELIDNHVIDCLLPLKEFPKGLKRVADFGTGGGLPGVMYAIAFPETEFFLYEKSQRKQEYLNRCRSMVSNMKVEGEIPAQFAGVDLVMARGFKPIDVILDMSRNYYGQKGKYFLLKARKEKIDEEMSLAQKKFKGLSAQIIALKSPVLEVERHLVLI